MPIDTDLNCSFYVSGCVHYLLRKRRQCLRESLATLKCPNYTLNIPIRD